MWSTLEKCGGSFIDENSFFSSFMFTYTFDDAGAPETKDINGDHGNKNYADLMDVELQEKIERSGYLCRGDGDKSVDCGGVRER